MSDSVTTPTLTLTLTFADPTEQKLFDSLINAIQKSESIRPVRKSLLVHRLKTRPKIRQMVMDEMVANCYSCGAVTFAASASDPGEMVANWDWEKVLQLIIEYLPQIIQLIMMFF